MDGSITRPRRPDPPATAAETTFSEKLFHSFVSATVFVGSTNRKLQEVPGSREDEGQIHAVEAPAARPATERRVPVGFEEVRLPPHGEAVAAHVPPLRTVTATSSLPLPRLGRDEGDVR